MNEAVTLRRMVRFEVKNPPEGFQKGWVTTVKAKRPGDVESQELEFELLDSQEDVTQPPLPKLSRINDQVEDEVLNPRTELTTNEPVIPPLLPFTRDIMECYQWNENGDPIVESTDPLHCWERYIPDNFRERPKFECGSDAGVLTPAQQGHIDDFVRNMRSNLRTFEIRMGDGIDSNYAESCERKLYRRIYGYDVKKIKLTRYTKISKIRIVTVVKLDTLSSYDENHEEICHYREGIGAAGFVKMINENAAYANKGPGTQWCRNCDTAKNAVTRSAVVKYGHGMQLTVPPKRFFCCSSDVVYLLHCSECFNTGSFAIHVGFTTNCLHDRLNSHFEKHRHNSMRGGIHGLPDSVLEDYVNRGLDPDNIRQDSHIHFYYEHPELRRKSARVTVVQHVPQNVGESDRLYNRRHLQAERQVKVQCNAYSYLTKGRGGLVRQGH